MGKNELQEVTSSTCMISKTCAIHLIHVKLNVTIHFLQGLEVIESTNLRYFTKEMTAEFYALKGMFLAQIGRSDDANKAFSAAVQMHDTLVKAWALWGDYLEGLFTRERYELSIKLFDYS